MRISRLHNNLERRGICEDILCRWIAVSFEFIGYESYAHSEAVHKAQGPHNSGDKRVAIVGFHGEILRAGLAIKVAGVHDVIGKGTDSLTELFCGIDGDGALGAFILSVFQERKYGGLVEHINSVSSAKLTILLEYRQLFGIKCSFHQYDCITHGRTTNGKQPCSNHNEIQNPRERSSKTWLK